MGYQSQIWVKKTSVCGVAWHRAFESSWGEEVSSWSGTRCRLKRASTGNCPLREPWSSDASIAVYTPSAKILSSKYYSL